MFLCHFPLYNLFEKGSLIVMSSTSVSLISYKCFFPVLVNLKHDFFFLPVYIKNARKNAQTNLRSYE